MDIGERAELRQLVDELSDLFCEMNIFGEEENIDNVASELKRNILDFVSSDDTFVKFDSAKKILRVFSEDAYLRVFIMPENIADVHIGINDYTKHDFYVGSIAAKCLNDNGLIYARSTGKYSITNH